MVTDGQHEDSDGARHSVTRIVEFIGAHPFATGLLAILGIIGFILSVTGFVFDRSDTAQTTAQIDDLSSELNTTGEDISDVKDIVSAACSFPPCWTLREFAHPSTVGRSKDLVDRKVPPAEQIRNGQHVYLMDNCPVGVEFTDGAVTFLSVRLYSFGSREEITPCDIDVDSFLGSKPVADLATSNGLTVSDALDTYGGNVRMRIAAACIDCGNYSEPYLDLMIPGSHAMDFQNTHLITDYRPLDESSGIGDYDLLWSFEDRMRRRLGLGEYDPLDTQDLCNLDLSEEIRSNLGQSRVVRIAAGRGPRTWTDNLFCKWWE